MALFRVNGMAAKVWPHPIKAIIFDNDGTLVDTEWVYSWAHEKITGEKLSWDLKPQLMGKPARETCELLIQRYNLKMPLDELMEYRTKIVESCWDSVKLLPGAREITDKFETMGIPMAIATSSRKSVFEQKTRVHLESLMRKIHHVVTGSDVKHGKPHPEIFLTALAGFTNVKPEEALVFEDSPLGIKAANDAGMPSVFIPDPNMNMEVSLAENGAKPTVVIKSLNDFDFSQFDFEGKE